MKDSPKTCKHCGELKTLSEFPTEKGKNGKLYVRARCKACDSRRGSKYQKENPEYSRRATARRSQQRATGVNTEKYIRTDPRSSDRKTGRDNDLTHEFIAAEIEKGCRYCGESKIRMTLDRIDNDKGHTQDNVVPACIRCNYTRKNMPYEAWLVVAKGMREAREAGLFNGWTGRGR